MSCAKVVAKPIKDFIISSFKPAASKEARNSSKPVKEEKSTFDNTSCATSLDLLSN